LKSRIRGGRPKISLSKRLLKTIGKTNAEFGLIGEGDRVLVGLSGGKDSLSLIHALKHIQRNAPFDFEFEAVTIKYGMPNESYDYLSRHCEEHEIAHTVHDTAIYDISQDAIRENSSYCSFFSRMRRGSLYSYAIERGFTKIALGHHFDDAVESFFMNMFYNGSIRSLAPIYKTARGVHIIRPLILCRERQLRGFADDNHLQTIGDESCPAMMKNIKLPYARAKTKEWLEGMEQENPNLFKMIEASMRHIHDDTLLDPERWIRGDIEPLEVGGD